DRIDLDLGGRQNPVDRGAKPLQVVRDDDRHAHQHRLPIVHRVKAGFTGLLAENVDHLRRLDLHVRDLRIGDENARCRSVQTDEPALTDLQAHLGPRRCDEACGFGRCRAGPGAQREGCCHGRSHDKSEDGSFHCLSFLRADSGMQQRSQKATCVASPPRTMFISTALCLLWAAGRSRSTLTSLSRVKVCFFSSMTRSRTLAVSTSPSPASASSETCGTARLRRLSDSFPISVTTESISACFCVTSSVTVFASEASPS